MKKLLFSGVLLIAMTSCYNSKLLVGNVTPNTPLQKVNQVWNHHLIVGLVPLSNATMETSAQVNGADNYVVKTNMSFLNMLVGGITCGIYTPTTTTFYLPLK